MAVEKPGESEGTWPTRISADFKPFVGLVPSPGGFLNIQLDGTISFPESIRSGFSSRHESLVEKVAL